MALRWLGVATDEGLPGALTFGGRDLAPVVFFGPMLDRALFRVGRLLRARVGGIPRPVRHVPRDLAAI
jgi:hypothetical protein